MEIADLFAVLKNGDGYAVALILYYFAQKLDKVLLLLGEAKCKFTAKD